MDDSSPTQKQRAGQYAANLGYFRRPHYLRRLRLWFLLAAVILSIGAVITYRYWGKDDLFIKGALSQGHARLAQDCRACHTDGQTDALKARLAASRDGHSLPMIVSAAFTTNKSGKDSPHAPASLAMDQACLRCHPAFGSHLPQTSGLSLRTVTAESVSVHAENCFVCHREHTGTARMALPDASQCASCHGDSAKLAQHRHSQLLANPPIKATGQNVKLPNGLVSFIAPSQTNAKPVAFSDFAHGHPAFSYEAAGLKDPAKIKFNHQRHLRPDLSGTSKDHPLNCTDCHVPGPGGNFKQPVTYEQHCQQCHTLQLLPSLPNLRIPHHDAEKVRWFLASIRIPVENAIRAEGVTATDELKRRADAETDALQRRGLRTLADLEQRVFFEGDPSSSRIGASGAKFLTDCGKCHNVAPATADRAPAITPPNMAMRWLQKGSFTHQPHSHMACVECHGAAKTSKDTADILIPTQKSCAECHRAPQAGAIPASEERAQAANAGQSQLLAAKQRERGGIKWDCQACHVFHSPAAPEPASK